MSSEQLPLSLPLRASHGREDFLVAPCNAAAVALIDAWPNWPSPAVILCGPSACGKSHLADVWRARSSAASLVLEHLDPDRLDPLVPEAGAWVLENVDMLHAHRQEQGLYHLLNLVGERSASLLMTSRAPVNRIEITLADARSRLRAAPQVEIAEPDDVLLGALLLKQFSDRQIRVAPDAVHYLALRLERRFDAVRNAVERLDRAGLAKQRALTTPFIRSTLFPET